MAVIKTRDSLVEYIRATLGEPIITVEVTDQQIDNIITATIQKFSDYGGNYERCEQWCCFKSLPAVLLR